MILQLKTLFWLLFLQELKIKSNYSKVVERWVSRKITSLKNNR